MNRYQITYRVMSPGGTGTQHIERVGNDAQGWEYSVAEVIEMIGRGYFFFTFNPLSPLGGILGTPVEVVPAWPPYIRSTPDGTLLDNLLTLPSRESRVGYASFLSGLARDL